MHEASSGHRYSCAFGFGQREPQVLGGERHGHSRRAVLLVDNLAAVSLVHPGIKQRIRQDIVSEVAIDPAFRNRANASPMHSSVIAVSTFAASFTRFANAASSNNEKSLPEAVEQRTHRFHRRR